MRGSGGVLRVCTTKRRTLPARCPGLQNASQVNHSSPVTPSHDAGLKAGAEYLGRVAFGTALLASVAIVFTALTVLASSRDDNNGRGGRGGGGGYYGGGPRFYFDLTDLLWYWDPFYYRRRRERLAAQRGNEGMNFLEAIFSWVFGDGDPNADFDKKRWQAVSEARPRCLPAAHRSFRTMRPPVPAHRSRCLTPCPAGRAVHCLPGRYRSG